MASPVPAQPSQHQILTASVPPTLVQIFLHNKLHPLLPYSLPLYRRCQFYLYQLSLEPSAPEPTPGQPEVWVAVSSPVPVPVSTPDLSHTTDSWLTSWLNVPTETAAPGYSDTKPPHYSHWLAAHIDMREPGQTQVWAFGSWESTISPMLNHPSMTMTPAPTIHEPPILEDKKIEPPSPTPAQTDLGRSLYHRLRTHHVPSLSREPSRQYLVMKEAGKIVSSPYRRSKVLFGTLAEASWWLVDVEDVSETERQQQQREQEQEPETATGKAVSELNHEPSTQHLPADEKKNKKRNSAIAREDRPYLKYILPLPLPPSVPASSLSQPSISTSNNYRLAALAESHLQTVLDRSPIPRSLELLKTLPSMGLFPVQQQQQQDDKNQIFSKDPVAWGILSKDASVASLHTEDEYRGRGFAEVVTRELIGVTGSRFASSAGGGNGEVEVEVEVPYAHTDISPSNIASRRVFEKMGARVAWRVAWVEIDVGENNDENNEVVD